MQLAEGLPLAEADRIQLQQVTLNLIVNAIQAMCEGAKDGRELLICTSSMNGANGVTVTVQDSGPGISPEGLKRTAHGMGLAICQSIIASHRGRI